MYHCWYFLKILLICQNTSTRKMYRMYKTGWNEVSTWTVYLMPWAIETTWKPPQTNLRIAQMWFWGVERASELCLINGSKGKNEDSVLENIAIQWKIVWQILYKKKHYLNGIILNILLSWWQKERWRLSSNLKTFTVFGVQPHCGFFFSVCNWHSAL